MDLGKQREKLAAWLAEWRLDQELPPPETTADATPPEATENGPDRSADLTVAASGAELKAGDVVLLPPVGEVTSGRPVYVALLEEAPRGGWLCAPFSRFSTPATEGEFETDRGFDPLKVVCAWNANALSSPLLAQGWLVGHLAAPDVKALADFAAGKRAELPPARRGPPLVHPLAPRQPAPARPARPVRNDPDRSRDDEARDHRDAHSDGGAGGGAGDADQSYQDRYGHAGGVRGF